MTEPERLVPSVPITTIAQKYDEVLGTASYVPPKTGV